MATVHPGGKRHVCYYYDGDFIKLIILFCIQNLNGTVKFYSCKYIMPAYQACKISLLPKTSGFEINQQFIYKVLMNSTLYMNNL